MERSTHILKLESVDSTNTYAADHFDTLNDGTLVVAETQTSGHGRLGRKWHSPRGNIYASFVMKDLFGEPFHATMVSSLAVLSVLNDLVPGHGAYIKWPNDIYAADKKICGMLIEHTLCGANLSVSTSGIGININQKEFDSSLPNPTSLILETGEETPYDRKRELLSFLSIFCDYYSMARAGEYGRLEQEYLSCLYRKGEYFKYIDCRNSAEETIEAKIIGIDQCACLLLEKRDGSVDSYSFKEIKYII